MRKYSYRLVAMNAFESGEQKAIPSVLVYAQCEGHTLMLQRALRSGDIHSGKWNGLGGKLELGESPLEGAQREFFEESGLSPEPKYFDPCGTLSFPNFKSAKREDWIVFLFRVRLESKYLNHEFKLIEEGRLEWIPNKKILELNLWEGDRLFLPQILAGEALVGTLWYEEGRIVNSWIQSLHLSVNPALTQTS